MRYKILIICLLLQGCSLRAQAVFVPSDYFPAQFEFRELQSVEAEDHLDSPAEIESLADGPIFSEAGAQSYQRRVYSLPDGKKLTIEILALGDFRAAYSLLTLLGGAVLVAGTPGDYHVPGESSLSFAQDRYWVRARTDGAPGLLGRVATSVSNRIGRHAESRPALLKRLPEPACIPGSERYLLGPRAMEAYARPISGQRLEFPALVEVVQAEYSLEGQGGMLTLLSFPTMQMAEDYFDGGMALVESGGPAASRIYARRAGPLIAILDGNFDADRADRVLDPLEYQYSVRWIYDKSKSESATVWGSPFGIMSTVVRSMILVSLLCLMSIVAGVALAFGRIALRTYAPHNILDRPERTELIRLKIDED